MLALIDHQDSFTYNIVQAFQQLGQQVDVHLSSPHILQYLQAFDYDYLVLGPGPGSPDWFPHYSTLIHKVAQNVPILGICLGHQCIAAALGARIMRTPYPMHGKASWVTHVQKSLFQDLPNPLQVGRYHSLVVDKKSLPSSVRLLAESTDGQVMALEHISLPIYSVQFHPESVLSTHGLQLLNNFLHSPR